MRSIAVGCCGFPKARADYFRVLRTVEIGSTFTRLPKAATARRWREEAPAGFEFSVRVWNRVTHPAVGAPFRSKGRAVPSRAAARFGHFQDSDEVRQAWADFSEVSDALGASFAVFDTPESFYPGASMMRGMYSFFKGLRRGKAALVWEPRGTWDPKLLRRICTDLGLLLAGERIFDESAPSLRYLRVRGRRTGRHIDRGLSFSDRELEELLARCGDRPAYVYFGNHAMWPDALRFADLAAGLPPSAARKRRGMRR